MRLGAKRLALALAAGGLTAGGLTWWHGASKAASAEPMGTVLVVKKRIGATEALRPEHFAVEARPARYIPPNAVTSAAALAERSARWDLVPGDILLEDKLYAKGEASAPLRIPDGKRAVAVAVDEVVGVAGFVQPGSLVDVIAVVAVDNNPVSKLVLQNVPILAVAQEDEAPEHRKKSRGARISSSVTLAVTPAEAEKLVLATERGKIRLAMRAPDETAVVQTAGSSPASLQGVPRKSAPRPAAAWPKARKERAARPPRPAPAPAAPQPAPEGVDVIRGGRLEQVKF